MSVSVTVFDLFLLGIVFVALRQWAKRGSLPLPPGPKGWPLIGNMLNMPNDNFLETYNEWGQKYGTRTCPFPATITQTIATRLRQYRLHQRRGPATYRTWRRRSRQ